ncbi:MAG: helix-turn-helix domain-containing protein [Candidatus Caldarchaeum sp.]
MEAVLELRIPYYCFMAASKDIDGEISVDAILYRDGCVQHLLSIRCRKVLDRKSAILNVLRKYPASFFHLTKISSKSFIAVAETHACMLCSSAIENGCFIEREQSDRNNSFMTWRVLSPSRKNLNNLVRDLKTFGANPSILYVGKPRQGKNTLTAKQARALETAAKHGFFETPRRVSTISLAELLKVSPSTFSETLRRALNKIVNNYISTTHAVV